ncbi:MAG TPA: flagellar basal-body MS-ring/collar protein FliF [Methylomusa anaerophila]|uniref:Flagellar M-ring protein n=1 Tax=Methylomusa anaerophila TaxID=1930071 RepID=A0A348AQ41_9FIRM|nr:flagellar basal-body MS-ring/collar protein FliF [Methylomusa anaerophila]BBB93189.1 flagellar M-ring protein [Methylomusa anaerophila]HML86979.1 flagellar basal-body MS-ring/collar protein FliF [Methylomusa anaerophila]
MAEWKEQSLRLWQNLSKKQRYFIIGSAVFIFLAILVWSYWWGGRPDNVPLFTNLDAKDAGEVAAKLKEMKIPYEIGNNGSAILVSSKDVHKVRLELARQGLPRGNKGFELFDQNKFGATEFQNKVNLLQAIQGELTRTIEQMDEVEKARVHIVMPEDSLYKKNEKPATASIMLKLRPSAQLTHDQIKGIVNLVAHSVQGLKPENITVVDNYARVLNDQGDSPQSAGPQTLTQFDLTKKIQDELQKNVQSLLDQTIGVGRSAARVNVELNFDQRTFDKQTFEPVVDDKGIIRSSQELAENYNGTTPNPVGGVPGTTTNIPGYVTSNNTQSNYEKKEVTRNYEINETKEKVVSAPGTIKRLTVAVLVDTAVPRPQQDSIARTVASAIGINASRGDTIAVESIPFGNDVLDKQRKDEEELAKQQQQAFLLKAGLVVLAILVALYLLRLYVQRRQKEEAKAAAFESQTLDELAAAEDEAFISQSEERDETRRSIEKLAKSRPEEVAQLLKAWLAEE